MNKITTTMIWVAGGMVAGGAMLYFLMPKDAKNEIKNLMGKISMKDNCSCGCDSCK